MNRFYATALMTLCLCAAALSCAAKRDIRPQLDRATARFHERFNGGQMNEIYQLSSNGFKATHPQDEFTLMLASMRIKTGDIQSSTRLVGGDDLTWQPTDKHPIAVYDTKTAKGGIVEHFTWDISGVEAILDDYFIDEGQPAPTAK